MAQKRKGGGATKVLYTLNTARKIGWVKTGKALSAKNTCKACGLGMGGQRGGMTNELGEFPSVCNKSVQAQSTDIQPPIPHEIFDHSLTELAALAPRELEQLGRLGDPIYKATGEDHYRPLDWDEAMSIAATRLASISPERTFFYASGRSSNEAGFLFQLLARIYGTNNVTNCSYYCHQATGVGLGTTIGTGSATVELADLSLCDTIFVIGANPASNHPRFIHQLKACRDRGGEVIVINPAKEPGLVRFALPKSPKSLITGGSDIASAYVQPKIGGDIAVLKAISKAVIENGDHDQSFLDAYTQGAQSYIEDIRATPWSDLETASGVSKETFEKIASLYGKARSAVFAWGMGITHHLHGVDNVEAIANLALLRGMIGRPGAGLLPLRGHSNVQGIGTIGVKPVLPDDVIKNIETYYGLKLPRAEGLDTMASMQSAADGKIDAAVMMGGNLFAANPNRDWAKAAMAKIGFQLSLTTTLNQNHVIGAAVSESLVLPVTARDEEWEPTTQESMFNFVRLSDGGINRLDNVRPESVILADLATALLPGAPIDFQAFKRHADIRKAIAEIVPGMEKLASIDVAKEEFHIRNRLLHNPKFRTPSGKASFKVHALPPKPDESAPFTLSTVRSEGQFNSIIYEEHDSYRGAKSRWSVLVGQADMERLKLSAGDRADLRSAHGMMQGVTVVPFDLPDGCLMAYYPEANCLTSTDVDPRSKTPAFKATPVSLTPAGAPPA